MAASKAIVLANELRHSDPRPACLPETDVGSVVLVDLYLKERIEKKRDISNQNNLNTTVFYLIENKRNT